jgi:penicillin amidase/acyl-homoserine-lactone acylase
LHGFNRHLGWANTVNKPDLIDVYRLITNPDDAGQYRLDDQWRDFESRDIEIEVRLIGPFAFTAHRTIQQTEHGPVIEGPDGIFAVRYAGRGEVRQLEQYRRLNKAENIEDWLNGMRMLAAPSINYVYADDKGNVGLVYNAQFPDRTEGQDWSGTIPGDQSSLIWQGYRPFEFVPRIFNPESGFVFNANNTPYLATDGDDNLTAAEYPASMGIETGQTNRSLRLFELSQSSKSISRDDLLRIKFDTRYSQNSLAAATQRTIAAHDFGDNQELAAAAKHLADWDLETTATDRHAALGVLTIYPAIRAGLMGQPVPDMFDSFEKAVRFLINTHGRIDPEWQEVNKLRRGNQEWAVEGGPDTVRAIYGSLEDSSGKIVANAGDTLISITEWDENGEMSAASIHQFGSATMHEQDPHFADQAPLFSTERLKPVLIEREEILEHASRRYRPGITTSD